MIKIDGKLIQELYEVSQKFVTDYRDALWRKIVARISEISGIDIYSVGNSTDRRKFQSALICVTEEMRNNPNWDKE